MPRPVNCRQALNVVAFPGACPYDRGCPNVWLWEVSPTRRGRSLGRAFHYVPTHGTDRDWPRERTVGARREREGTGILVQFIDRTEGFFDGGLRVS